LAASLAAFAQGVRIEAIRQALMTFTSSAKQTPGRMNLFDLGRYHALVDYAHNPAGYEAVGTFVQNWPGSRIGVVGGPGDRRDEDFVLLGQLAAQMFDEIIIKEDDDNRGRPRGSAARWIEEGITAARQAGTARIRRVETILDETTAVNTALDRAGDGNLVVVFPESVSRAINLIEQRGPRNADTQTSAPANVDAPNVDRASLHSKVKSV
jgi:cyanophycin synthetase